MNERTPTVRSRLWIFSLALLPLSLALYVTSLMMDVATAVTTVSAFGVERSTEEGYRLLSTIRTLYEDGEMLLAFAITAFTIVFPISKYVGLAYVLFARDARRRGRTLSWIKNLGQWSMGDVFVVAFLVVLLRINTGATMLTVRSEPGLAVFAASVITSMIVSVFLAFDREPAAVST